MATMDQEARASLWWHCKDFIAEFSDRDQLKQFGEAALMLSVVFIIVVTFPVSVPIIAAIRRRNTRNDCKRCNYGRRRFDQAGRDVTDLPGLWSEDDEWKAV